MAIKKFFHKGLNELFCTGKTARIGAEYHRRLLPILDALDAATCVEDLRGVRGFHAYAGERAGTLGVNVSANWRVTFRFEHDDKGDVLDVDFEDPHR